MRLTKIYTRTGDKGSTSLADGTKTLKTDLRIEAYGNVDELNSFVGLLRDEIKEDSRLNSLDSMLSNIQHELFDIGGELATPIEVLNPEAGYLIQSIAIERLESEIDQMNGELSPLKNFVLPGGLKANSIAHVCRTVCRRAERFLVGLHQAENDLRPEPLKYLNRLSDWFFVASRFICLRAEAPEILWNQKK